MHINRRVFLKNSSAFGLAGVMGLAHTQHGFSNPNEAKLSMPPLLDTTKHGFLELEARAGKTNFTGLGKTPTIGFNQPFLGPTVRVKNGDVRTTVENSLSEPITVHWHGLLIPGAVDGGPHATINSGKSWDIGLPVNQAPATIWYHTHIHKRTGIQVHSGLAGAMQITDGRDNERGLPNDYGVDDLMLVLQDRRFDDNGQMRYAEHMMDIMHGYTGDTILVNGQIGKTSVVPKGIVRLRILNGSNARIYSLAMNDGREFHLVGTDGGYLPKPITLKTIQLSPGERAEILVDFSDGKNVRMVSSDDPNQGAGGMMGRFQRMFDLFRSTEFTVLNFAVDDRLKPKFTTVSAELDGNNPDLADLVSTTRYFSLDMGMGPGMMGRGMMGGRMMEGMAINNRPFDLNYINHEISIGTVERWIVTSDMLLHPFHIHGALFQVAGINDSNPRPEQTGWKDTVLVDQEAELYVKFDQPASRDTPFMYHCHILEHEDAGMMGQFAVL